MSAVVGITNESCGLRTTTSITLPRSTSPRGITTASRLPAGAAGKGVLRSRRPCENAASSLTCDPSESLVDWMVWLHVCDDAEKEVAAPVTPASGFIDPVMPMQAESVVDCTRAVDCAWNVPLDRVTEYPSGPATAPATPSNTTGYWKGGTPSRPAVWIAHVGDHVPETVNRTRSPASTAMGGWTLRLVIGSGEL